MFNFRELYAYFFNKLTKWEQDFLIKEREKKKKRIRILNIFLIKYIIVALSYVYNIIIEDFFKYY